MAGGVPDGPGRSSAPCARPDPSPDFFRVRAVLGTAQALARAYGRSTRTTSVSRMQQDGMRLLQPLPDAPTVRLLRPGAANGRDYHCRPSLTLSAQGWRRGLLLSGRAAAGVAYVAAPDSCMGERGSGAAGRTAQSSNFVAVNRPTVPRGPRPRCRPLRPIRPPPSNLDPPALACSGGGVCPSCRRSGEAGSPRHGLAARTPLPGARVLPVTAREWDPDQGQRSFPPSSTIALRHLCAGLGEWPPEENPDRCPGPQWASPYGLIVILTAGRRSRCQAGEAAAPVPTMTR